MSRPRAAVLLTGNELVRGVIGDRNGCHLAENLEQIGFAVRRLLTVGDGVEEIAAGLAELVPVHDLVVTSGGLGPTHDDRTVEAVARVAGVPLEVDRAVLETVTRWTDEVAERFGYDPARFAAGNLKQAHIPAGASVLGIAGTAPGLILNVAGAIVVVLPGVPSELRRLWAAAPDHPLMRALVGRAQPRSRFLLRTYGIGESHVADLFAAAGSDPEGVETSICARSYEIEVDVRALPGAEQAGADLADRLARSLGEHVFSRDRRTVAELVLDRARAAGLTVATAESCTAGMVASMLTDVPGSSDVVAGGVVAYADAVKTGLLGVDPALLERHGAVSAEAAAAMAAGVRERLGAGVGVAVTGIAGPGGATPGKSVGLVFLHVSAPGGEFCRRLDATGGRAEIRARAATAALHLLRTSLAISPAPVRT
ncbi:MAG TPA: CinA family nicotinamide mononucleotide deamidase-related protein [Gaiellales bacterium]|nr:CinA family nicotinamide mononucleotide deamidase-related protein [Gaiellales bacterium]